MEASIISAAIVEGIVSSSIAIVENRNGAPPEQERTCAETQEEQKHEEKENTVDDQGM